MLMRQNYIVKKVKNPSRKLAKDLIYYHTSAYTSCLLEREAMAVPIVIKGDIFSLTAACH